MEVKDANVAQWHNVTDAEDPPHAHMSVLNGRNFGEQWEKDEEEGVKTTGWP